MTMTKFYTLMAALLIVTGIAYGEEPQIEVLNTGEAPRHVLRLKAAAGQTETMVMDMNMEMSNTVNGNASPAMPIPKQRMIMTIKVDEVTEQDELVISYRLDKIDLIENDPPSPITAQIKPMLESIVGMSGTYTVTRTGNVLGHETKLPEGAAPAIQQQMVGSDQMISQMAVPLPEQAVGVGASWTVSQPVDTGVFSMQNKTTYTVVSVNKDDVELKITIAQTADPQDIDQNGIKMQMKEFSGNGSATTKMNLGKMVPHTKAVTNNKTVMQMQMGDQNMSMQANVKMTMDIAPQ